MSEQRDSYEATKARLEEISAAARGKDVTLEKSIELLEEAVRLANLCTEHVDQVGTFAVAAEGEAAPDAAAQAGATGAVAPGVERDAVPDEVATQDLPGDAGAAASGTDGAEEPADDDVDDDASGGGQPTPAV